MSGTYAGDVTPEETWNALSGDPKTVLIDVRTDAEWLYVGLPDLRSLGKEVVCISWQNFPAMQRNPAFLDTVQAAGIANDQPLYLICRSGVRSRDAAIALTSAGYAACYNVAGGFEGNHDPNGHRGTIQGWKVAELPWRQG